MARTQDPLQSTDHNEFCIFLAMERRDGYAVQINDMAEDIIQTKSGRYAYGVIIQKLSG